MSSQKTKKIGFEIEFAEIPLKKTSKLIQELFGGHVHEENEAVYKVKKTELGEFKVELDAEPVQKIAYDSSKAPQNLAEQVSKQATKKICDAASYIVPFEIVTPPISEKDINQLEELRKKLFQEGAEGTSDKTHYAFGLHINPEEIELKVDKILQILQSFLVLEPWLQAAHQVDTTRKVTSYIDPFPVKYMEKILDASYSPSLHEFIKDYHQDNPTRNRPLDMLPILTYMDEKYVRKLYGNQEKINKRPTYHYRIPNSNIGNPSWTISHELDIWKKVEWLANNKEKLHQIISQWKKEKPSNKKAKSEWARYVAKTMNI